MRLKQISCYLLIVILPFVVMIVINESVGYKTNEKGHTRQGVSAINAANRYPSQCSWACHDDTAYCKSNHVKLAKPYFDQIDSLYFGLIDALQLTGNYGLANVLFLVVLLPLLMFVLLVRSIALESKIRQLNQE